MQHPLLFFSSLQEQRWSWCTTDYGVSLPVLIVFCNAWAASVPRGPLLVELFHTTPSTPWKGRKKTLYYLWRFFSVKLKSKVYSLSKGPDLGLMRLVFPFYSFYCEQSLSTLFCLTACSFQSMFGWNCWQGTIVFIPSAFKYNQISLRWVISLDVWNSSVISSNITQLQQRLIKHKLEFIIYYRELQPFPTWYM